MIFIEAIFWMGALTGNAHAATGFHPITDENLPQPVREASGSVFRGLVLFGKPQLVLKPSGYDAAIRLLESQKIDPSDPIDSELGLHAQTELVRICKAQKLRKCESGFPHTDSGTFFLQGDPQTLVTARHVVEDAIEGVAQANLCKMKKNGLPLKLILLNSEGKIVFQSINGPTTAMVRQTGADTTLVSTTAEDPGLLALGPAHAQTTDETVNDFAIIKTNQALDALPLQWGYDDVTPSLETFYTLGYPAVTTGRDGDPKENSDGRSFYFTVGKEIRKAPSLAPNDDSAPAVMAPTEKIKAFNQAVAQVVLVTDSDLNHGMSGGPVVDARGAVHGIAVVGFKVKAAVDLDASAPECSWAIRPKDVDGVTDLLSEFLKEACN